jgi:hypothetical protein
MDHIKKLIHEMPSEELRANVQVCLEHSCAIFLEDYRGLGDKEMYIKERMNLEREIYTDDTDLEFKNSLNFFYETMNAAQFLWHKIGPVKNINRYLSLKSLLLGVIQAFELSHVPSTIPPIMEALATGQWKNFVLSAVGLMSPSGMKMEVLGEIIMYLICRIQDEDFLTWCKREIVCEDICPSFNLYANQSMEPLEKLLGEAPET